MLEVWAEFPWKKKRKKKSGSRFAWLLLRAYLLVVFILVGLPLLLAALWYLYTTDGLVKYYAYTLFPQIGAQKLEMEYKATFDDGASVMNDSNNLIDAKASTVKKTKDVENFTEILKANFVKRDNDYIKMISLDKKALSLRLPNVYKTFYIKRLAADTADYAAFKTYREGEEKMIVADVAFARYENDYGATRQKFMNMSKILTNKNISEMEQAVEQSNADYQEIAGIADTVDSYSQGILDLIQNQHDVMSAAQRLIEGYVTHNNSETTTASYDLMILTNKPSIDPNVAMSEWYYDKLFPVGVKQDTMHEKAWIMYADAYAFAKSQHLYSIINIWGENIPTAEKEYTPKTASPYQT